MTNQEAIETAKIAVKTLEDFNLSENEFKKEISAFQLLITFAESHAEGEGKTFPLRQANIERQKEWDVDNQVTIEYRGNELAGECGEACNIIKKIARERMGIRGTREGDKGDWLDEELADIIICADLIAMMRGIDLLGENGAVVKKFNATSEKCGLKTRLTFHGATRSAYKVRKVK